MNLRLPIAERKRLQDDLLKSYRCADTLFTKIQAKALFF